MSNEHHWDKIYATTPTDRVGWYAPHLNTSLNWIQRLNLNPTDAIIDVGGGAATLVDDLMKAGFSDITVLDISIQAIQLTQERLDANSRLVSWLHGDVTKMKLPNQYYRVWHDRAVFHFLIQPEERQKYKDALLKALQRDGFFIIGTFSPEAPPQCSGLPVHRFTTESLSEFFGCEFELRRHQYEVHITPSGVKQSYVYCLYQRIG